MPLLSVSFFFEVPRILLVRFSGYHYRMGEAMWLGHTLNCTSQGKAEPSLHNLWNNISVKFQHNLTWEYVPHNSHFYSFVLFVVVRLLLIFIAVCAILSVQRKICSYVCCGIPACQLMPRGINWYCSSFCCRACRAPLLGKNGILLTSTVYQHSVGWQLGISS